MTGVRMDWPCEPTMLAAVAGAVARVATGPVRVIVNGYTIHFVEVEQCGSAPSAAGADGSAATAPAISLFPDGRNPQHGFHASDGLGLYPGCTQCEVFPQSPHPAAMPGGVSAPAPTVEPAPVPEASTANPGFPAEGAAGAANPLAVPKAQHVCDHCTKAFTRRGDLKAHVAAAHPITKGKANYTPEPDGHVVVRLHGPTRASVS